MKVKEMFSVSGKKCIVTGASRGIGKGFAEALLENGATVVLMASSHKSIDPVVEEFKAKGYDAYGVAGNLSSHDDVLRMFKEGVALLGGQLDVLVPCAGIQYRCPIEENEYDKAYNVFNVNVRHCYIMAKEAVTIMEKQENGGKLIFVGSLGSHVAGQDIIPYSTSKGAVDMMAKAFARNCANKKINSNLISPGWIATDIWSDIPDERKKEIAEGIPQGRVGFPEDMKGPLLFLASSASDYVNGAEVVVDGALLVKL